MKKEKRVTELLFTNSELLVENEEKETGRRTDHRNQRTSAVCYIAVLRSSGTAPNSFKLYASISERERDQLKANACK